MAAPLSMCTKEEQHGVIHFLWSEGVPGAEIHRRLPAQYGASALPRSDEERAGRPSTSITDSNVEVAHAMILEN